MGGHILLITGLVIVNNWFSLDTIGKLWIFLYLVSSVSL